MTLKQAIDTLQQHQQWRRGAEVKMLHPEVVGEAIDIILIELNRDERR